MGLLSFGRPAAPSLTERIREDFDREVLPHFKEIYRAALRMTRRPAEAEDVTQEVFLQAWKSFDRYERGTNGRAWLYKILWNVHQQKIRKRVPTPLGAEGEAIMAETLAAPEITPTEITDTEVSGALENLSDEHRQIVLLSDVDEFTYKEIASILKIPIGTVMSRLSRARAALRLMLHENARRAGIISGPDAIPQGVTS
ncbi:MAG: sigma-70 family RNA polymerase sigma factor [Thermoanaerobaculia bacterium]